MEFVYSHSTITELLIQNYCGADAQQLRSNSRYIPEFPPLKPGSLPLLRVLACTTTQAIKIIGTPSERPRPIERMGGMSLEDAELRDQFMQAIAPLPFLDRLELVWSQGWEDVARIGRAAPNLRWLRVCSDGYRGKIPVIEDNDIVSV